MIGITLLVAALLAPLILVTAYFAVEVFAGLAPLRASTTDEAHGRIVVVIPAHDEEPVIESTVRAIAGALVLVVADNCSDRTGDVARSAGAEVLVRNDRQHRGKGFALAAARDQLRRDPPDVVVVLDADCRMDDLEALALVALRSGRACQSVNLLSPDLTAAPMVQISTFAFMIKNLIRQRGLQRLAGRAHLTGTGMAFPWKIFEAANLGGANIVEDLAMGLELADRVAPPVLVERATVWSPPASQSGTLVQRRRWEGGYLATALKVAPRAIGRSLARADVRGLAAALNLSVPPLALLVLLNVAGFCLGLAAVLLGASPWPLVVQVTVGLLAFLALASAWSREGRRVASGGTLLRLPLYVLWKLPLYLGLARRGAPQEWLRTGR